MGATPLVRLAFLLATLALTPGQLILLVIGLFVLLRVLRGLRRG